jgi:hypothetical protein
MDYIPSTSHDVAELRQRLDYLSGKASSALDAGDQFGYEWVTKEMAKLHDEIEILESYV